MKRRVADRSRRVRPLRAGLLAAGAAAALAGCGKASPGSAGQPLSRPVAPQGAVSVVTRNTSRIGGSSPAIDAAAVARAVYPGLTSASRPPAVVVVDGADWDAALAASVLASAPVGAPILLSEGGSLPEVASEALASLHPSGISLLGGAQVIRVGTLAAVPAGLLVQTLPAAAPAQTAAQIARELERAAGAGPPKQVIILPAEAPRQLTMSVAGLAAESGAPILYVRASAVPHATLRFLGSLRNPSIYVADASALAPPVLGLLSRFGRVSRIGGGGNAVQESIALARYTDGSFGWGIKEPGHGLVFANIARPLDGPAAALLSASGEYGPLLLLEGASGIPNVLSDYLGDIQPAYSSAPAYRPVRGVYNHGWLIGDEKAISAVTQAEIDSALEITASRQSGEEPGVEQSG